MDSKRGWLAWTGLRASFGFRCIPLLALAATPLARANEAQSCDEPTVSAVPACSDGDGVLEDADIAVAVEKTTSHGFADLSLVVTVNRSTYAGGKETKAPPRIVRNTLHYDGKTYGSDTFREFWYGDAP
jgi:hypothetical protein